MRYGGAVVSRSPSFAGPPPTGGERSITAGRHRFAPYTRLTQPLVRDGGELRAASWDEALTRAADGFRATRREAGPRAVGFFSCSKSTNEMNYIAQKFARAVIGTNNIDSCNRT